MIKSFFFILLTFFVFVRILLEENNKSSTRFRTDIRILSNKFCEIGDNINFASSGIVNGSDDLQAATKYYVDNNSYYSSVNLYVSTASGDDTQAKTPAGREGRAWQYAYKTIGAAALQADTLVNLSQVEPGPYRQTIAYTVGAVQTNSTISSITLTGGNSAVSAYTDVVISVEPKKLAVAEA